MEKRSMQYLHTVYIYCFWYENDCTHPLTWWACRVRGGWSRPTSPSSSPPPCPTAFPSPLLTFPANDNQALFRHPIGIREISLAVNDAVLNIVYQQYVLSTSWWSRNHGIYYKLVRKRFSLSRVWMTRICSNNVELLWASTIMHMSWYLFCVANNYELNSIHGLKKHLNHWRVFF